MRPGSVALVGAADEHRVGVHPDQLEPVEVVEEARHRQREHPLAREHARGDAAGRLQLVVVDRRSPSRAAARRARARDIVVEFVTKRSRCPAPRRPRDRVDGARDRLAARRAAPRRRRAESPPWTPSLFGRNCAFRFSRSSGPGGQHAQKSSTRVEALFDVAASAGAAASASVGGCSRSSGRSSARSPRTSARSSETASSRPSGSSSSWPRRRGRGGDGGRRSRPRARASDGSRQNGASPRPNGGGRRPTTRPRGCASCGRPARRCASRRRKDRRARRRATSPSKRRKANMRLIIDDLYD